MRKEFAAPKTPTEEEYFKDMKEAKDGFEVNAEFIGRGLFRKPESKNPVQKTDSEGRCRLQATRLDSEDIDAIPIQELKLSLLCSNKQETSLPQTQILLGSAIPI